MHESFVYLLFDEHAHMNRWFANITKKIPLGVYKIWLRRYVVCLLVLILGIDDLKFLKIMYFSFFVI